MKLVEAAVGDWIVKLVPEIYVQEYVFDGFPPVTEQVDGPKV